MDLYPAIQKWALGVCAEGDVCQERKASQSVC